MEGSLKLLYRVHFNPKELDTHDKTDGALDHARTLLLMSQLLQLHQEFLLHCWKPDAQNPGPNVASIHAYINVDTKLN